MWAAGLLLLVPSLMGGFLLVAVAVLATAQLVAAAVGMRWQASISAWMVLRGLGLLVWVVVVPIQVLVSASLGGFWPQVLLLPLLLWLLLPLLSSAVVRSRLS